MHCHGGPNILLRHFVFQQDQADAENKETNDTGSSTSRSDIVTARDVIFQRTTSGDRVRFSIENDMYLVRFRDLFSSNSYIDGRKTC